MGCKGAAGAWDSCCRSCWLLSSPGSRRRTQCLCHGVSQGWHQEITALSRGLQDQGRVATPCTALRGSRGRQGAAVVLHRAVPQPQPPQGTAQESTAEQPGGSGRSCASRTTRPWEKERLGAVCSLIFFLPELKEIFVGITKSQNARAYLSTTQPSRLSVADKDAPDVAEELAQSLLLRVRLPQDG